MLVTIIRACIKNFIQGLKFLLLNGVEIISEIFSNGKKLINLLGCLRLESLISICVHEVQALLDKDVNLCNAFCQLHIVGKCKLGVKILGHLFLIRGYLDVGYVKSIEKLSLFLNREILKVSWQ